MILGQGMATDAFMQANLDGVTMPMNSSHTFAKLLVSQMTNLQSALLQQHDEEVSALRAENQALRERLFAISDATSSPALEVAFPLGATEVAPIQTESQNKLLEPHASNKLTSGGQPGTAEVTVTSLDALLAVSSPEVSSSDDVQCSEDRLLASQPEANEDASKEVIEDVTPQEPPCLSRKNCVGDSASVERKPSKMPFIKRIVFSHSFEIASGLVILANTMMMALRLQYDGIDIGFEIGVGGFSNSAVHTWPHAEATFYVLDIAFNIVFIIELLFRVAALQGSALRSGWVWFDMVVIAISVVDTFGSGILPVNPSMLRLLRIVRLVRLLKILKAMSAVDSLFLLLKAIHASASAAMWSFSILIIVQVVTGLFLNQMAQAFLQGKGATAAGMSEVFIYYGTFSRTMLTMFEITMASWSKPCRVLVENVHESYMLFFMFYRCLFCFALLKVISAVFITETNRVLQHDDDLTLMKLHRERERFDRKMQALAQHVEGNALDWEKLKDFAYDRQNRRQMSTIGLHPQDLEKLFWLLDDGSKSVPLDAFLKELGLLKCDAKAIDVYTLLKITRKIDNAVTRVFEQQGYLKSDAFDEALESEICRL